MTRAGSHVLLGRVSTRAQWGMALGVMAVLAALLPTAASAHPLGNFTVNHYARIDAQADGLRIQYVLDEAEIPTFQDKPAYSADPDRFADDRASALGDNLHLTVDGQAVPLHLESRGLTFADGAGGLPTLRLEATFSAAFAQDSHPLQVQLRDDNDPTRIGWREIIASGPALAQATVPNTDVSNALRQYPNDLLNSPPNVREATLTLAAAGASVATAPNATIATASEATGAIAPEATAATAFEATAATAPNATAATAFEATAATAPDATAAIASEATAAIASEATVAIAPDATVAPAPAAAALASALAGSAPGANPVLERARTAFADLANADELTPAFILFAVAVALVLGAAHALQPGHGKTVVAAYLVGSRGTARHAAFLGATVTATHTAGVYALGLVTLALSQYIVPERLYPVLEVGSGLLVVAIGVWLFGQRLLSALRPRHAQHHHHHEGNVLHDGHTHSVKDHSVRIPSGEDHAAEDHSVEDHPMRTHSVEDHSGRSHSVEDHSLRTHSVEDHSVRTHSVKAHSVSTQSVEDHSVRTHPVEDHSVSTQSVEDHSVSTHSVEDCTLVVEGRELAHHQHGHSHEPPVGWRSLLALCVSGGLLPCPEALMVLLITIAAHRVLFGLLLIVSFSTGLAAVLVGFGLLLVYARTAFQRLNLSSTSLMPRLLPVASALVIVVAGSLITAQALPQVL